MGEGKLFRREQRNPVARLSFSLFLPFLFVLPFPMQYFGGGERLGCTISHPTLVRTSFGLMVSTNQMSTVALTSISTYYCKENNAEMYLLCNDLLKI